MTSLWGFHQEYFPRQRIVTRGGSPRATILLSGICSWWKPHRDVISVYYTEQNTKHKRGKYYKHQRFCINTRRLPCNMLN